MNILQLMATAGGGVPAHVRLLTEVLRTDGHHVDVACEDGDVAVRIGSAPNLREDMRARRLLRQTCSDYDVVHAHGLRAGALAALARSVGADWKLVVTLHNRPVGGKKVRIIGKMLLHIIARRAGYVLAVSPDLLEWARSGGVKHAGLALVPAPELTRGNGKKFRTALEIADEPIILQVARLSVQKNLPLFLEALKHIPHRHWRAVIIGEGPQRAVLQHQIDAEQLPVVLAGRRSDIADALAAADVFCSTASWEGQPVAIQEALAAGVAIVATDVGGTRVVTGDRGAILTSENPEEIGAALTRLLNDEKLRAQQGAAASARAKELPSKQQMLGALMKIYAATPEEPYYAI
ncbi:MAG: glycosyltransferase family 4 protein [Actinomycetaceae bacterium]|nr:glycosyltransferase family 4 protein [Actinomycetaceae bacterium]